MEIDITHFFNDACPRDYSASVAEIGPDAAKSTWDAACADAEFHDAWLCDEDKRDAMRDFLKGFGAWEPAEIKAMSDRELTALLMQFIAGDIREASLDAIHPDWHAYEEGAERGTYSGRISHDRDTGRVYYYIGD